MIALLIYVLIVLVVICVVIWAVRLLGAWAGFPPPVLQVVCVIIGLIGLLLILYRLLPLAGVHF